MTIKIDADTTSGLQLESDTSGIIDIQSAGVTKMTVGTTIDIQGNELVLDADADTSIHVDTDDRIDFKTGGTDRFEIDSSGNVEVLNGNFTIDKSSAPNLLFRISDTEKAYIRVNTDDLEFNCSSGSTLFRAGGTERMRMLSSGRITMNTTDTSPADNNVVGTCIRENGLIITNSTGSSGSFGRTADGTLVTFYSAGNQEGSISVSGSTVSYNGGHLSRWGRLSDGSQPTILKGTVMSNLDEMVVWSYDDVLYTEEDELPEGKSVGDVKTPAYTAENEQRNQLKISDVEGDINVAGLFVKWDTEEDGYNDIDLAMTGDMVIRIAQGTTVQRGDLLMSAGDGTAKPQEDDIVRSKTIAKVTSTTVINTYDDGSYVVPCVVMAC